MSSPHMPASPQELIERFGMIDDREVAGWIARAQAHAAALPPKKPKKKRSSS
jgi:hypothetical protein